MKNFIDNQNINNEENGYMPEARSVENKACVSCTIGSTCLLDDVIPDFEVAGLMALYGIVG